MILSDTKSNAIISALSSHKQLWAKELLYEIGRNWITIKQAQLYNTLNQLQKKLIIYKKKTFYMLHPVWIEELRKFVNHAETISSFDLSTLKKWESKRIVASSFADMCMKRPYYASIIFQLSWAKEQRKYCQHHAYSLSMLRKDIDMPDVLDLDWVKQYDLCWNDTFLDRYSLDILRIKKDRKVAKDLSLFDYKWYNINIIWDYVIQVHLWDFVSSRIDSLYNSVESIDQYDIKELRSILKIKEEVIILVSYDPKQAKIWRDTIGREINQKNT